VSSRTEQLLSAPIVPTLVRLAAPGLMLVAFQSMVSIGDTFFVGLLGTEALAGLALVFPLVILFLLAEAMNFDPSVLGPNGRPTFPDISDNLIMLLTGGNGLYLADKMNLFRNGVAR